MTRRLQGIAVALLLAGGAGATAWAWDDTVASIAAELKAAATDRTNHSPYADLVRAELASVGHRDVATYAMPCFWSGEAHFGGQPGVYRTTPGYLDGKEVVRVEFDPAVTSREDLLNAPDITADKPGACRFDVTAVRASRTEPGFHPDDEYPAWYLRQTDGLKFIPMTPAQTARIDSLVHANQPYKQLLSPRQQALLARVLAKPESDWTDFAGRDVLWNALRP